MLARPIGRVLARSLFVWLLAVALGGVQAGTAHAQDEPPGPESPAVIQYQELVPTAEGPTAPGVGRETRTTLPPKSKRKLEQEDDATAAALEEVATSSTYGAPSSSPQKRPTNRTDPSPLEDPSVRRALESVASSAVSVDESRLLVLLATLLVITGAGIALGTRQAQA